MGVGMRLTGENGLFHLPQVTQIVSNKARTQPLPNPKPGFFPLPYTFTKQVQQTLGDSQRHLGDSGEYPDRRTVHRAQLLSSRQPESFLICVFVKQ